MWVAMLAWRKEWQVDSMLDQRVLSEDRQRRLTQIFPHGLHGVDNKVRTTGLLLPTVRQGRRCLWPCLLSGMLNGGCVAAEGAC